MPTARSFIGAWRELETARYKAELYRMWHVGNKAGLTHGRILSSMGEFKECPPVEAMRRALVDGAERRDSLVDSIKAAPEYFTPFEVGLLGLGEEAGGLEDVLRLLGTYFESEYKRVLWVKKKMTYPMINVLAAIFIAPFPILFFGDAPRYLMIVGTETAAALAFGGFLVRFAVHRFRRRPKLVAARLLRALAVSVEAGLPLDRVLDLGAAAAGDASLSRHLASLPPAVKHSQPLVETLAGWSRLPQDARIALATAGRTGDYTMTLRRLADLYDDGF